ncbi:PrpF domain-containing protein [Pseudorhodoferax sp.]|uniref:PrpF domain-containing protein n=1 Tax=Pseudorhodoferax sp. TaxID=1993553 RepID=UPI002DD66953|nr:PrpF domain-containing protein [Pseudorhodoferax sp.]
MTQAPPPQIRIPASYLRGGTSKGVFFRLQDLPARCQQSGPARDALLLRVVGSPDPYGKQTDGMGGATSSTSKTVILSRSTRPGHDVDYLFGQVAIDQPFVDWSGNCGNLSAAVGPFAIAGGLVDAARIPQEGLCTVRIWQANIGKTIVAHVPMANGQVQESGDFALDGVTFPAAEVQLEFLDPADEGEDGGASPAPGRPKLASAPSGGSEPHAVGSVGALFPTGNVVDTLDVPGVGRFPATLINAGIPTIFLNAADLGYTGRELQGAINGDPAALARFETIRAWGAVKMGLIRDVAEAATRQHTPKIAFVAPPAGYTASSGKAVRAQDIDLLVRALSMGQLHHAMMGTAAVAIGTAAAVPGTLVNLAAGGGTRQSVRFGHPSGTLRVGAEARQADGQWTVTKALMSRSARVLMEGFVRVPAHSF